MDDSENNTPKPTETKNGPGMSEASVSFDRDRRKDREIADRNPALASSPSPKAVDAFDDFVAPSAVTPTFTGEEAISRSGNYVLSFGLGGSGKSTFHSFLLRYLEESGKFDSRMNIPTLKNGEPDQQTRLLLNQWRQKWKNGSFVRSTGTSEAAIREILYSVTPLEGVKQNLEFGMVEVSGELLVSVLGGRTGRQAMPDAIHQLIANSNVDLTLMVMVHPETPQNDLLFTNLVDYITERFPRRMDTMGLGVIIANPDLALKKLIETTGGYPTAESEGSEYAALHRHLVDDAVVDYLKVMAPGIRNKFNAWPSERKMVTPLRLGNLELDPETGKPTRLIEEDFSDISKIFGWIYKTYTGRDLGPTWFQKLFTKMNEGV